MSRLSGVYIKRGPLYKENTVILLILETPCSTFDVAARDENKKKKTLTLHLSLDFHLIYDLVFLSHFNGSKDYRVKTQSHTKEEEKNL